MSRSPKCRITAAGLGAALCAASCAGTPESTSTVSVAEPAYDQFVGGGPDGPGVHAFLEKQCGTLDCHGQVGRPFRLYSVNGLRDPNDPTLVSGLGAETAAELYSNFLSAVGLEPEEMGRVVQGMDPPTALLIVKKPMGLESHKGGIRIVSGDSMYACLTSWLSAPSGKAPFDVDACTQAASLP
jgi:hypothetical protein